MKATVELLNQLKDISRHLLELAEAPAEHDLDTDAIVELNLARDSIDKLVRRVENILS
jgi:hypothetical protein